MSWLSFILFVVITSFTPGPNNFVAMNYAQKFGLRRIISYCCGVAGGFFLIILLSSIFNRLLTKFMPVIELPLTIFGAAYMLYLAFKIVTSKNYESRSVNEVRNLFIVGILLQFINPKGILFGITVVSAFILPYYDSYSSYFAFALLLGTIGLLSTFSWGLFGTVFQRLILNHQKIFNVVMAIMLVYSAISIMIK
ncbi:LysE family translocator [Paenibacillus lutimineralis]|uniref:Lysine transporter LysE n=1 Tax=Paenibacillus lutimineralis TaxID=2707005 RepID=A0A3Q9IAP6_9BACL|nr:LysE family transporter [Paenibacillus lutimineralis]AZS14926.1 lysine transporter LysE [Paenibacillus lutimineralis]